MRRPEKKSLPRAGTEMVGKIGGRGGPREIRVRILEPPVPWVGREMVPWETWGRARSTVK